MQKADGLQIDVGYGVDISGYQRCLPGVGIIEYEHANFVEIGAFTMPAIMPGQFCADARIMLGDLVRSSAVAALPVNSAISLGWQDNKVVIGQKVGEIGIARLSA